MENAQPSCSDPAGGASTGGASTVLVDCAVPYIDQFVGLWLMREENFFAGLQLVKALNISLHVQQQQMQPQQSERRTVPGGYGYRVTDDGIAVMRLSGTLMKQQMSMEQSTSTVAMRRDVRMAGNDPAVRGVLFDIDSPGGTVAGAYDLADDIAVLSTKKPTASHIPDLGASAAYLMAIQTGEISAGRTAEVGSIGTRGVIVDASARAAMLGFKVHVIASGGMKGAGVPGSEITAQQLEYFRGLVMSANMHFVAALAKGRKMSLEKAGELADGRVHPAAAAQRLGLIDHVENFDAAVARLRQRVAAGSKTNNFKQQADGKAAGATTSKEQSWTPSKTSSVKTAAPPPRPPMPAVPVMRLR